jgi:hypothetical protein
LQVACLVVLGLVAATTNAGTLIDMPALRGADIVLLTENPAVALGPVALNRYSYRRVTPLYSYRSPPAWPWYWSGWRVGYPFGFSHGWGFGYGYGFGWGWRSGWPWGYGGRYVIGSRSLRGFRFRGARGR